MPHLSMYFEKSRTGCRSIDILRVAPVECAGPTASQLQSPGPVCKRPRVHPAEGDRPQFRLAPQQGGTFGTSAENRGSLCEIHPVFGCLVGADINRDATMTAQRGDSFNESSGCRVR